MLHVPPQSRAHTFHPSPAPKTKHRRKTSPDASSLFDNNSNIQVVDGVDVATDDGAGRLVQALEDAGNPDIDVLINNAGVMSRSRNALDINVIRESMEVNAYGALRITSALLRKRLLASPGAKIVLITSKMGSMADNSSGGEYAYRMSKAALNAAGVSLAHDLKGNGIAVAILHPGESESTASMACQRRDQWPLDFPNSAGVISTHGYSHPRVWS